MREKNQNKFDYVTKLVIFTVILCVCFLSLGYSAFSNTAKIESAMATIRPIASARITNVMLSNTLNGGISNSEDFSKEDLLANISLPNADSTVTYKVDVTVFLSSEMNLTSITGLPSNLEYSISGYNMGDILCDSHGDCNLGATDDIFITIGYKSGEYNSANTTFPIDLKFNFEVAQIVAKIGSTRFQTLQDAIDAVPTDNTQTTIDLLMNTSEVLTVVTGQNIVFNFHGNTITNSGVNPVITNTGTIRMSDGTIICNTTQGAVNNNAGGVFYISGGTIKGTNNKQAIYNDGGTLVISGTALLQNSAGDRPAVHNKSGGSLTILGGTIESTRYRGVDNSSTMVIGTKDGSPVSNPVIVGKTNGVYSTVNFDFYDGFIKGGSAAFNDESYIDDTETGFVFIRSTEQIDNVVYQTARLGMPVTITFNANGGNVSEASRIINKGEPIGSLPLPTRTNYQFDGWYDAQTGGNEITSSSIFNDDDEIFAHWSQVTLAKIGNTEYPSLQSAINAVPNNTQTTITIVKDILLDQAVTIAASKNIIFDLQNHTISNRGNNMPLFENNGISEIKNGTLTSNATQGAVNNRVSTGRLTLSNLTINATGTRQAVYNAVGTTTIKDNCVLTNTTAERATVHNTSNGTINILSASITANNYSGVFSDSGTINIGSQDGNVSSSNPSITGSTYGVEISGSGVLNYYDGIIKGITDAISGTISDQEGTLVTGTDGSYKTVHLE